MPRRDPFGISKKDRYVREKDRCVSKKDKNVSEKDKDVREKDKDVREKDMDVSKKDRHPPMPRASLWGGLPGTFGAVLTTTDH